MYIFQGSRKSKLEINGYKRSRVYKEQTIMPIHRDQQALDVEV